MHIVYAFTVHFVVCISAHMISAASTSCYQSIVDQRCIAKLIIIAISLLSSTQKFAGHLCKNDALVTLHNVCLQSTLFTIQIDAHPNVHPPTSVLRNQSQEHAQAVKSHVSMVLCIAVRLHTCRCTVQWFETMHSAVLCRVGECIFLHAQHGCVSYVYDGPTLHLRFLYWGSQGFFQAMHCLRLYDDTSTFYIYLDMESHNSMIHIDVLLLFFVLICVLIVCVYLCNYMCDPCSWNISYTCLLYVYRYYVKNIFLNTYVIIYLFI